MTEEPNEQVTPGEGLRQFSRWADEGGLRVQFTETRSGGLVVEITGLPEPAKATLANFRVDHLKRWLSGENVQPW